MPQLDVDYKNRNAKVLASFVAYCKANPNLRFWQALRNWSGFNFVYVSDEATDYGYRINAMNTFYWEGRNVAHSCPLRTSGAKEPEGDINV